MSSRLPRGTIAAIVIGVAVVVIAFAAFSVVYFRRRRREARRKQSFIVNPRFRRRFSSFLSRPHPPQDSEKASQAADDHADASHDDVLEISAHKDDESDDEDNDLQGLDVDQDGRIRHGSQNSDGSYAINLPELPRPGSGHVHLRSSGESPSPTHRYSDLQPSNTVGAPSSPLPFSSPLRSPKPKGPRERRAVISSHGRDSSRGILLKEMYPPAADVPTDVNTNDSLWPGMLPQPNVSPLRVNFEDELSHDGERRRETRHRSDVTGISLPSSLRQALLGHIRPSRSRDVSPAKPSPTDPRRYSFLDLESSSASTSSPSNRQSRAPSTRSSIRTRSNQESSDSAPSDSVPPVPRDPRVSMGLSMTMAGGPTSSRPSQSPAISLQAVSLSPITIPDQPLPQHPDAPAGIHPMMAELPSPTDSIPMTVSDIHFRHSVHSSSEHISESRRTSHRMSNSQRVHPPLPNTSTSAPQQAEERPYIVQRILGLPTASGPSTPFGSPTAPGFTSRWSRGRGSGSGPTHLRPRTGPP